MQFTPTNFRTVLGRLAILLGSAAAAGPLQLLSDARSVQSSGTASSVVFRSYDADQHTERTEEIDAEALVPVVHPGNRFGSFEASNAMALRTAAARLDGQGFQQSVVSSSGVQFTGLADVLAVGDRSRANLDDHLEETIGSAGGSAGSSFKLQFAVQQRWSARLTMASDLRAFHQTGFDFRRTGDNGFGWTDPSWIDGHGDQQFNFSTLVDLAPGLYTLEAALAANAAADNGFTAARRVSASFSLVAAPVPEPSGLLLGLAGVAAVAWRVRARQRA